MASTITDDKTSISIDVDHGFIRRYAVAPANIHDSQMLPRLLDPENEHDYVWVDSAYSGECFEDLLSLGGFESLIHEKGAPNNPLSEASKELNRIKSAIRACVEHVFGCMAMSMGGKMTRRIGLARTEAWWGSKISPSTSSDISSALPVWLQLHRSDNRASNLPPSQMRQGEPLHHVPLLGRHFYCRLIASESRLFEVPYIGFVPLIVCYAMHCRAPALGGVRVHVVSRQVSLGYASIYLLVFFRSLLLLGLYLHSGLSWRAAQGEIHALTKDMSPESELVAYFWMRWPSFVVMDSPDKTWVSAEGTIFDGDERTLALYERQSGKRVKYIVFPQLGHMQSPPGFSVTLAKPAALFQIDGRTSEQLFSVFSWGEIPGYHYAFYRLVGG